MMRWIFMVLAVLREQGGHEVQGFYYSKPLPADPFEAFVRKGAAR